MDAESEFSANCLTGYGVALNFHALFHPWLQH